MIDNEPIILIGFMGVGKTRIAHLISDQLSFNLIDLDTQIQNKHGEIFNLINQVGEVRFRELEYEIFQSVGCTPSSIIATGGGIVTYKPSRQLLFESPLVVWLKASFNTVQNRIENDKKNRRPLADHLLFERFESRQNLYKECASFMVDVDDLSPQEVAEKIINRYG